MDADEKSPMMAQAEIIMRLAGVELADAMAIQAIMTTLARLGPEPFDTMRAALSMIDTVGPFVDPTTYHKLLYGKSDWKLMRDQILPSLERAAGAMVMHLEVAAPWMLHELRDTACTTCGKNGGWLIQDVGVGNMVRIEVVPCQTCKRFTDNQAADRAAAEKLGGQALSSILADEQRAAFIRKTMCRCGAMPELPVDTRQIDEMRDTFGGPVPPKDGAL